MLACSTSTCACRLTPPRLCAGLSLWIGLLCVTGCASTTSPTGGPTVIVVDGAGWAGSERGVRAGLRAAGFRGHVETFSWSTLLGPLPDHLLVGRKERKGQELAKRIQDHRATQPPADLHLMGLSAGSAVIVFALENLPPDVKVDNVVFFAPSISAEHDLSTAMERVRGCLYATSSPQDGILAGLRVNADGQPGPPAGLHGLRVPSRVRRYDLYARVVNLSWRPAYDHLGWNGSHTGATGRQFVQEVIAPRILSRGARPLDQPIAPAWIARWRGSRFGAASR